MGRGMHLPSFFTRSSLVALALSAAACSFGIGESTEGDQGKMHFEYTGGDCLLGCGLDRNALQGSLVTVSARGGDGDVRKKARLTSGAIGAISAQRESCSCETTTRDTRKSRSVEPSTGCASGETKSCSLSVDIETAQPGDSKLEITDFGGNVVDRVTVHVRPAARIDVDVREGGTNMGGVYEVKRGSKVKLLSEVFDADGSEVIFARHGVSHAYGDKSILQPDAAVLVGSTDVEDMLAIGLGETTVKVRAEGAEKLVRFRIVP